MSFIKHKTSESSFPDFHEIEESVRKETEERERLIKQRPKDQIPSQNPHRTFVREDPFTGTSLGLHVVPPDEARYMLVTGHQWKWQDRPLKETLRYLERENRIAHKSLKVKGYYWRPLKPPPKFAHLAFEYLPNTPNINAHVVHCKYLFYSDALFGIVCCVFEKTARLEKLAYF